MCTKLIAIDVIAIVVSLINLAEQFGIYTLQKVDGINDQHKRSFFAILYAVDAVSVFECLSEYERDIAIVAIIVDMLELICYVASFHRTTTLYLVGFLTYRLEMLLNGLNIFLDSINDNRGSREKYCFPAHHLKLLEFCPLAYMLLQLPQVLVLSLQSVNMSASVNRQLFVENSDSEMIILDVLIHGLKKDHGHCK